MNMSVFLAEAGAPAPSTSPAKQDSPNKIIVTQPTPAPIWSPWRSELGARTDIIAVVVVVVGIGVILFGWALLFRRPSGRTLMGRTGGGSGRRRRGSRSEAELPRNPSLKERGGLPPVRPPSEPGNPGPI